MDTIRIRSCAPQDVTVIPNQFLDRFLPTANGDFLKIYLYLLRSVENHRDSLSLSGIADDMNCTEKDVERALRYWEQADVVSLAFDEEGGISELSFGAGAGGPGAGGPGAPGTVPETTLEKASDITSERLKELGEREDIRELFFISQQYLGRPLSRSEMQRLCYFYDGLHMAPDLIDYLVEYCISRGHTSFHYIEKVALNWKEQGITTVREARVAVGSYHREYYDILKALGINNHHPIEAETRIMKKWIEKYGFSMEIITEACTRTVMNAQRPTLSYADGILSKWYGRGVRTMEDVAALDREHSEQAEGSAPARRERSRKKPNTFTDFEQRDYDYEDLEARLLKKG